MGQDEAPCQGTLPAAARLPRPRARRRTDSTRLPPAQERACKRALAALPGVASVALDPMPPSFTTVGKKMRSFVRHYTGAQRGSALAAAEYCPEQAYRAAGQEALQRADVGNALALLQRVLEEAGVPL